MKLRIFTAWTLALLLAFSGSIPAFTPEAAAAGSSSTGAWWFLNSGNSAPSVIVYGGLAEWWHNSGDIVIYPDNILENDVYFGRVENDGGRLFAGAGEGIPIGEQLSYWLSLLAGSTGYYSPLCNIIEIAYGNYDFSDTAIEVTRSELYAWGDSGNGALIYDEYYIFRITRNDIDWEEICVRFYSETDGGDSIEARLYGNSPHGGWANDTGIIEDDSSYEMYDCIYMGDMYVADCDGWTYLREDMDITSMQLKKIPEGALVSDCYAYGNGFTYCEYEGAWGYILSEYLTLDCEPVYPGNNNSSSAWVETDPYGKFLACETYEVETLMYGATSYLTDSHGIYDAGNAFDSNPDTAWSEGMSGHGQGQELWCTWEVTQGQWWVQGVALCNGYQKSNSIYSKNNRVRLAEIWINNEHFNVTLYDCDGWQYVMLPFPIYIDYSVDVSIVIDSVYIGNKYSDTCISEMDLIIAPTDAFGY